MLPNVTGGPRALSVTASWDVLNASKLDVLTVTVNGGVAAVRRFSTRSVARSSQAGADGVAVSSMRSSRGVRSVTRKAPKVRTEVERGCGLYDEAAAIELRRALAVAVELSLARVRAREVCEL